MKLVLILCLMALSYIAVSQNSTDENILFLTGTWRIGTIGVDEVLGIDELTEEQIENEAFCLNDSSITFLSGKLFFVNDEKESIKQFKLGGNTKILSYYYEIFLEGQKYEFVIQNNDEVLLIRDVDRNHRFGFELLRVKNK